MGIMFVYVIKLVKKIHLNIFIIFRGGGPVSVILAWKYWYFDEFHQNSMIWSFWAAGYDTHVTVTTENNENYEMDFFNQFNYINKHNIR